MLRNAPNPDFRPLATTIERPRFQFEPPAVPKFDFVAPEVPRPDFSPPTLQYTPPQIDPVDVPQFSPIDVPVMDGIGAVRAVDDLMTPGSDKLRASINLGNVVTGEPLTTTAMVAISIIDHGPFGAVCNAFESVGRFFAGIFDDGDDGDED